MAMKQGLEKQVTFFRNGQSFQKVEELPSSDQELFIDRWNKWETKIWSSAFESLHQSLDPKKTMTLAVHRKEND
jgi:hypothetical protein